MKIYFIFDGNKHEGPFTIEELQAKGIKRDTFVWKEGLPDWLPAEKIEELEYILPAPVIVEAPQPPAFRTPDIVAETPAVVEQTETTPTENKEIKEEKPAEIIAVKPEEKKQQQPEKAKGKFAVADEPKAEVKKKEAKPAEPAKVVANGAPKRKKSNAVLIGVIVVLLGGAVGYYFYTENQKQKVAPQTNQSLLVRDTDTSTAAVSASSSDQQPATGTEQTAEPATDENTTDNNAEEKTSKTTEKKTKDKDKLVKQDDKTANKTPEKTEEKKTEKPAEKKETVAVPKVVNPLDNLSVSGSYKKNIFGEGVLEGKLANSNAEAEFHKIVIEATYVSADGAAIKSEQFTKSGKLSANSNLSFKFRTGTTKNVKSVSYRIVSAQ